MNISVAQARQELEAAQLELRSKITARDQASEAVRVATINVQTAQMTLTNAERIERGQLVGVGA